MLPDRVVDRGWFAPLVNTSCLFFVKDETAIYELVSAVIVQAAIDFVDAHKSGIIYGHHTVDPDRMQRIVQKNHPSRCSLPKWMEPSDVYSCVSFLFLSTTLEDIIPTAWEVSPDAVRSAIIEAAQTGAEMRLNYRQEGL